MFKLPTTKTPILCQGMTSELGTVHIERALAYGSHIVAGTVRDKHIRDYQGIPVFQTVREAVRKTKPAISVVFSSPARALGDVEEAIRAKIPTVVCTTEHMPIHDTLKMIASARKNGVTLIGPSSPGIVRVGACLAGSIPAHLFPKGHVGIIGRSSSLIYEVVQQLARVDLGVSTCVSLGAAQLVGTSFKPILEALLADKETHIILAVGQVAGEAEMELAACYRHSRRKKPLVVYIPGQTADGSALVMPQQGIPGVQAEQIIADKRQILEKAGAIWEPDVLALGQTIRQCLREKKQTVGS